MSPLLYRLLVSTTRITIVSNAVWYNPQGMAPVPASFRPTTAYGMEKDMSLGHLLTCTLA